MEEMDDEVKEYIQLDFVHQRQQNPSVTTDDLHVWLTLSRFFALSFGESKLTKERWDYLKMREAQRVIRTTK